MRVLIVDDSTVYRSKIRAALSSSARIEVVGTAENGKVALDMISELSPDLVTLDLEMPVMDGLGALREIRRTDARVKVIVFSSSTVRGSEATLEALSLGADDFVTKPDLSAKFVSGMSPEEAIRADLLPKVAQFMRSSWVPEASNAARTRDARARPASVASETGRKSLDFFRPDAILIASSTGGPAANDALFRNMDRKMRCPIFIAQHMPPIFTTAFARRIAEHSGLPCSEAQHLKPVGNEIYVAPGDFHLTLKSDSGRILMVLDQSPARNSVRPAADFLFESAREIYGSLCMAFVLTGMGEDGLAGSRALKAAGARVMIQSQESCVVFGMPGAVHAADAYDEIGSLEGIRKRIEEMAFL